MPLPSSTPDVRLDDGPFRVLAVCTGNACRSPLAAAVLRARLAAEGQDVVVASAGLRAVEGDTADPAVVAEALRLGLDLSAHRARSFRVDDAEASHLVVVATRRQRAVAADLAPSIGSRTFTLLELDAVLAFLDAADVTAPAGATPVMRLAAVVRAASRHRGPAVHGVALDVPDPFGGSPAQHRGVADLVEAAATRVARRLVALAGYVRPLPAEDVS